MYLVRTRCSKCGHEDWMETSDGWVTCTHCLRRDVVMEKITEGSLADITNNKDKHNNTHKTVGESS